ncbi:MAG: BREX system P-loop protein BrxC, partial [Bacteroidales bacterium]|nr:BREX system P-loop protein BrxC [Bacteroidales bacterium]
MMYIKDFFQKDINRTIETVIKADDREHISDEVSEYVVTNEITKKIRNLFQAYINYSGANGVWISGFFGSGKSHLLKILSYVLENKEFNGFKSVELFADKIVDDEMLKGDVLATTRIPSESVLFNIDQQAQITSKSDENAILSVFYKVFYDHLGHYGFQPHVAEFEMWLNKQGQYEEFKTKFEQKHEKPWNEARVDYFDPLVIDDVAAVLAEMNKTDASKYENILDDIEDRQKQSIEDFCGRVNDYIKSKQAGFRLNFFVDEVGQYISNNTKLMLNLQTIAETLATKTKGKSWILVTSQEDMEKVVGDMNKSQQNDFSRIQARFGIKIPLTSANVDEVIEKRLLHKNDEAQKKLEDVFKKESAQLDTLLSFSDAGVQFTRYKGETDFGNKFPFVPYQFDLFQQCRRALSTHNAFQGKHASVGERSMLGVFQQVVQKIENKDEKALVSYDLMFEGIRNELRGEIQSSIILAEKNLENVFAVKLLKALFLVKYYRNFKTTKRNISVLMINDIHVDLSKHERIIDEALNMLENQSYVQRSGDVYEFLTDDEKDIEEEIKNTGIDDQAITQKLKEIFFDDLISDNKIQFIENKHAYDFTSKIDGTILGREKELEIEIITENFNDFDNIDFIRTQTMGLAGMKMLLPPNPVFMKDLKMFLKTNKYVKQNQSTSNRPEVKRILQEKAQLNAERTRNLRLMANKLLADSTVYLNGNSLEMGQTKDGKTKVINAFQKLIKIVYPNLKMIGQIQYQEDTFRKVISKRQDELFKTDDKTISEAENEILNIIKRRKGQSDRTSLNDLKTHFSKKPYGWYQNAVWGITAMLYKRGKIELKQDSNLLADADVLNALLNSAHYMNTLIEPQADIDPMTVKQLKQIYADAFDEACSLNEAKDVANAFKDKITQMYIEVNQLLAQKKEYAFLSSLDEFGNLLEKLSNKTYNYFLTDINKFENELLDKKEDLFSPIKRFMNGEQRKIYDDIKTLVESNTANIGYVDGDEFDTLETLINSDTPYKGNAIQIAKATKETLTQKVLDAIKAEKTLAIEAIEKAIKDLQSKYEFKSLDESKQLKITEPLLEEIKKLQDQRYIANIRDVKTKVLEKLHSDQLNEMMRLFELENSDPDIVDDTKIHYITKTNVQVNYPKSELQTENDVDDYVEALRKAFKKQ